MISPESRIHTPISERQRQGLPVAEEHEQLASSAQVSPAFPSFIRTSADLEIRPGNAFAIPGISSGTQEDGEESATDQPQLPIVALDDFGSNFPDLRKNVDRLGCASVAFESLSELIKALQAGDRFGLLLLNLPPDSNVHWIKAIRSLTSAPVLFMVNEGKAAWQLRSGGKVNGEKNFDFIFPPFDAAEIKLRVRNLISRGASKKCPTVGKGVLVFRNYRFQLEERKVFYEDREVALQRREYDLALHFFQNMDMPLARSSLNFLIRRDFSGSRSRVLDVYVAKLRKKLRLEPANGLLLKAAFGYGYELRSTVARESGGRY